MFTTDTISAVDWALTVKTSVSVWHRWWSRRPAEIKGRVASFAWGGGGGGRERRERERGSRIEGWGEERWEKGGGGGGGERFLGGGGQGGRECGSTERMPCTRQCLLRSASLHQPSGLYSIRRTRDQYPVILASVQIRAGPAPLCCVCVRARACVRVCCVCVGARACSCIWWGPEGEGWWQDCYQTK